jgi:hypothetical protein
VTKSENLQMDTDGLKETIIDREETIRDAQKIAAVRTWLDSRSELWVENFLNGTLSIHRDLVSKDHLRAGISVSRR